MKCLVVGGSGFIGRYLTHLLLQSGRQVVVLGRHVEAPLALDPRAEYVSGDYGSKALMLRLLPDVDEVVDLAYSTVPKSSFDDPVFDIHTNLPQAVNLLQAAVESGRRLRKLVFVSSGGTVYGHSHATPIAEDHPTNPVSPYGITKLAIEKYGLMFHRLYGLPVVVARPGNAYGEHQQAFRGQGFIATACASIAGGRTLTVFGGDSVVRDYVHVEDVVSALGALLDEGIAGHCYNVASGVGHTTNQVMAMIMAAAGKTAGVTPVVHEPPRAFDVRTNVLDCTRLQQQTGWRASIALREGINRFWAWSAKQPISEALG